MSGVLHDAAIEYARDGLEVFPCSPTDKRPLAASVPGAPSQYGATADVDTVDLWWNTWPDALIGHRPHKGVLILDIDPRHGGDVAIQVLTARLGIDLTGVKSHLSGRGDGGRHLWFAHDWDDQPLRIGELDRWCEEHGGGDTVSEGRRHVCGIDLLHRNHRYSILPPSPHPDTGQPYNWASTVGEAPLPAPLLEILTRQPEPKAPKPPSRHTSDSDSIADWFSETHSWSELLPRWGWTLRQGDGDSDGSAWRHPTATSPVSATVKHGCLFSYSPNCLLEVTSPSDPHGYTPFRAWAEYEHNGNQSDAARAARKLRDADKAPPAPHSTGIALPGASYTESPGNDDGASELLTVRWVTEAVRNPPPEPAALVTNFLRRGEVTVMGAPRALGKTWASLNLAHMAASGEGFLFGSDHLEVTEEANVLYLQGELGEWGSADRWRMVSGTKPQNIAESFDRCRIKVTKERITETFDGVTIQNELMNVIVDPRIEATVEALGIDLLIVDPWATFFAGNENSNDEVEAAITALTDIARRHDCAVFIVHHISAKTQHSALAEPEDLWRGASRLADAVATRVTMLPHYSPKQADELGLSRFDARKYVDIHVLERNGPGIPIVHSHRETWSWNAWTPAPPVLSDGGDDGKVHDREILSAVARAGRPVSEGVVAQMVGTKPNAAFTECLLRLTRNEVLRSSVDDTGHRIMYEMGDMG